MCCIPASVHDADNNASEEQQLVDTDAFRSLLYTEDRQQVSANLRLPMFLAVFNLTFWKSLIFLT